jgi:hypothetical protein
MFAMMIAGQMVVTGINPIRRLISLAFNAAWKGIEDEYEKFNRDSEEG